MNSNMSLATSSGSSEKESGGLYGDKDLNQPNIGKEDAVQSQVLLRIALTDDPDNPE